MDRIPYSSPQGRSCFGRISAASLSQASLPFAETLSAERIARIFVKHGGLVSVHGY